MGAAGLAAIAGSAGPAAAHADGAERNASSDEPTSLTCEVYNADVLVIGAGVSAGQAALQAVAEGRAVTLVDKGPFQFSGVGGMNFDIMMQSEVEPEDGIPTTAFMCQPELGSKSLYEKSVGYHEWWAPVEYVRQGVSTLRRNEDGTVFNRYPADSGAVFTDFGFMRHVTDLARDKGIVVYDQTMVTDFIVQDGVCRGAIGLHIPTGTVRVFRANAIVKSTGGCTQFYGWKSVGACSTQGGDNTADTDVAAMRHGCQLLGCEFFRWDTVSSKPDGVAFGYNAAFTCDTNNKEDIVDVDGNAFLKDVANRTEFFQVAARAVAQGKANEDGGFTAKMTPAVIEKMRPAYKRNIDLWKEVFGIDVEGAEIEVELQCYEHGGSPRVDDTMMVLGMDGLFDVRGGEALGTNGGMSGGSTHRQARYAASCAAAWARAHEGADGAAALDWSAVEDEARRLSEILSRRTDGGLRPHEIRHAIQRACYTGTAPAGNAEKYDACIAELERIIDEDLPRQVVPNKTKVFNLDWKQAVENYNVALIALATVKAMRTREETRAQFLRTDFPDPDDGFWGSNNVGISLRDGRIEAEPVPVEE